jgi:uncharacterized protein
MSGHEYIERTLSTVLTKAADQFSSIVLTGPRQSGKTTLVRHVFGKTHAYCTLDDPLVRDQAREDPNLLLERFAPPVILDEIQYAPDLLSTVKLDIDEHRSQPGRFVITGSQAFALMQGVTESLAGRAAVLSLHSFSLREVHDRGSDDGGTGWRDQLAKGEPLGLDVPSVTEFLWRGGYPEPALKDLDVRLWHGSYMSTYLERDVRTLRAVSDLDDFRRLVTALAVRTGSLINHADLARDIGVTAKTVKAWVTVLEASSQLAVVRPWFANIGKRLVKQPKIYFHDPGVLSWLLGIARSDEMLSGMAAGPLFETAVFGALTRAVAHRGGRTSIWFWRTSSGHEVDFLIEDGMTLIPIEAKLTATPRPSHATGLEKFMDLFPDRAKKGYLVCLCKERFDITRRVQAVPLDALG